MTKFINSFQNIKSRMACAMRYAVTKARPGPDIPLGPIMPIELLELSVGRVRAIEYDGVNLIHSIKTMSVDGRLTDDGGAEANE